MAKNIMLKVSLGRLQFVQAPSSGLRTENRSLDLRLFSTIASSSLWDRPQTTPSHLIPIMKNRPLKNSRTPKEVILITTQQHLELEVIGVKRRLRPPPTQSSPHAGADRSRTESRAWTAFALSFDVDFGVPVFLYNLGCLYSTRL